MKQQTKEPKPGRPKRIPEIIEILINKAVFPAFYRGLPIFYCSRLPQTDYKPEIKSGNLHYDYQDIINRLLVEQLYQIIKQSCIVYPNSKTVNDVGENQCLTPIEEIMQRALIDANIAFKTQVRIGNYFADFLVESQGRKFVVECDGRDYHNPYRDKIRDTQIESHGYNTLRFTGTAIWSDIDKCIDQINNYIPPNSKPVIEIDDLDDSQRQALNHLSGPIRVLAPAGSGKTRTLTNRIINLINNGIDPNKGC